MPTKALLFPVVGIGSDIQYPNSKAAHRVKALCAAFLFCKLSDGVNKSVDLFGFVKG